MANHSSVLAWWIPWTEEPGGLQSIGLQRVRHNWVTNTELERPQIYTGYNVCVFLRLNAVFRVLHLLIFYILSFFKWRTDTTTHRNLEVRPWLKWFGTVPYMCWFIAWQDSCYVGCCCETGMEMKPSCHRCPASPSSKAANYIVLGRKLPILFLSERKERMRCLCGAFDK